MNYRHAFHAGNAADVVKHIVLARIIEHLKQKPAPFRVIDLNAGTGLYDLTSDEAGRTGEWREGVGRLYQDGSCVANPLPGPAESLIEPWRKSIAAVNDGTKLRNYPGSPEIARRLVRDTDRLVFNELHPEDHAALSARFAREKRATISSTDGWAAAKAALPPPERRGVMLVDPPYEDADEVSKALAGLKDAHRRFATGIFCLWYPVKAQYEAEALAERFTALGLPKMLRAEVSVRRADNVSRLNGSGLILVNPPWKLEAELNKLLPALAERLADHEAPRGSWIVRWLTAEDVNGPEPAKKKPDPGGRVRLGERRPT